MSKLVTTPVRRGVARRHTVLGMAVAAALALPQIAAAYEFDTGNENLSFRWDNTLRVNLSTRTAGINQDMVANPNFDDGDRRFDTGTFFTRFDILSEMDLVWKQDWGALGARVSAAGWWNPAYQSSDNYSIQTANNIVNGVPSLELPQYTKRYAEGPSGEFLDWFLFGNFRIGEAPINVKVGQTTVYWGESLGINAATLGINYGQNPIDVWKGLENPGVEAKEVFRPRVGVNINSQITDTLNVAAQYLFNWQDFSNQAWRYPEASSYLSFGDYVLWGGKSLIAAPNPLYGTSTGATACGTYNTPSQPIPGCASQKWLRLYKTDAITPEENSNNYGIALRWSPEWVGGTIGAYYRRSYDMQPQALVTPLILPGFSSTTAAGYCTDLLNGWVLSGQCLQGAATGVYLPSPPFPVATPYPGTLSQAGVDFLGNGNMGTYQFAYGSEIDMFGLSLSKQVGGLSLGSELVYRSNMPLLSDPVNVLPWQLRDQPGFNLPAGAIWSDKIPKDDTPGAKGETLSGILNLVGVMGESIWDTASWSTELTWMTWLDVSQNEAVFKGRKGYNFVDAVDKNYFGLAINFTPTWFQVKPGMDVLAPVSWSQGISGNSPVTAGGQEGAGTFGLGIALDFYQRYRFDLKYVGFYGDYAKCKNEPAGFCAGANPNAVSVFNGTNAVLSDRDFVALTFKTSF